MQGQSEVLHSLAEGIHHALRIFFVFEADDEVIGVPHQGCLSAKLRLDPPESVNDFETPEFAIY